MKYVVIFLGLLCAVVNAQPAPNFVTDSQAEFSQLYDLKGKVIYLDFWASWCKPCRKSFPWMNDMHARYGEKGLQVIAVNVDSEPALAAKFLEKLPAAFPIVYDPEGEIASAYQLVGMPSSYLIDAQGNIRRTHKGFFTDKTAAYEQEIVALLNELE